VVWLGVECRHAKTKCDFGRVSCCIFDSDLMMILFAAFAGTPSDRCVVQGCRGITTLTLSALAPIRLR
jgi:hypothetical protein